MAKKTPAQKRQAMLDRTLYNPAAILGGKQLRQAVNRLVGLQVNPLLHDLDREREKTTLTSDRVTGNARSYFDQLATKQAALAQQAQSAQAASAAQQGGIAKSAQDAVAGMAAAAQGRVDQDASVRGDIARGAADQLAKSFADRAASMEARSAADRTASTLKGAASTTGAIEQAMASGQRGGEQMGLLTDRFAGQLGEIGAKRTEVLGQRANLRADVLNKLRGTEFEKLITMEGLGLDRDKLQADTMLGRIAARESNRHNTTMEANADRSDATTRRGQDISRMNSIDDLVASQLSHQPGLTPTQRDRRKQKSLTFWDKIHEGGGVLNQALQGITAENKARSGRGEPALPWNDATARAVLREEGYQPYEIDTVIAMRPSHGGRLTPALKKRLKQRHIVIPKAQQDGAAMNVGSILGALFG